MLVKDGTDGDSFPRMVCAFLESVYLKGLFMVFHCDGQCCDLMTSYLVKHLGNPFACAWSSHWGFKAFPEALQNSTLTFSVHQFNSDSQESVANKNRPYRKV